MRDPEKVKESNTKWKEENPDYYIDYNEKNKEKIRLQKQEYYTKNRRKILNRQRKYQINNKDKIKKYSQDYDKRNLESIRIRKRQYNRLNKDKINLRRRKRYPMIKRWAQIKSKYGLTKEMFYSILQSQNNSCAICKIDLYSLKFKETNIDHCHRTGKVRGILCRWCNTMLGFSKDSIDTLSSGISYLERNKDENK